MKKALGDNVCGVALYYVPLCPDLFEKIKIIKESTNNALAGRGLIC